MAYPMQAQPPPKQPPNPYPPYAAPSASPPGQTAFAPPAKRQRLSPDPRSPAANSPVYAQSPVYGNYGHSPVQSPYAQQYASPQSSFNTPQQYSPPAGQWSQQQQSQYQSIQQRPSQISPPPPSSSHLMPPPPRPKEEKDEKIGVDDIGDSLFGSGINLKDEENYLHNTWNNRHSQSESFQTNNSTSFGSNGSSGNNSYSYLTQNTSFGSQGQNGASARTLGQPLSQEDIEAEARRKREQAARRQAEHQQYHLNNQFLSGNCVRKRMHQRATENGVRLDISGVYVRNPEPQQQPQVMVNGAGTEGIAAVKNKPEAMIESGVAYEHMLTLLSLAAQERMRGLMDDAYALARARRYGDHGRVTPADFADIATGLGKQSQETIVPESLTGSDWDRPATSREEPSGELPTNGVRATPSPGPVQTVAYQGSLHLKLREIADRDLEAEKERSRKREARRRKNESDGTTPMDTAADIPTEALPAAAPKINKKEQAKKAKEAAANSEAQLLNQSNQTAAMMALGGKKNRYSWMSGGAASMPTNRFAKPGSGTATPKAQPEPQKGPAEAKKAEEKKAPTWGDWREDDVHGKGIELRDLILILDRDGKDKRSLAKALMKLPFDAK
ncbi:Putative transcription initiation factor TFIID component TAF4 [Septoria linicola]|uniref:Transcription initiation factor TFIID subunit 4 n=1 Tax=Septoria linicola TaxID=215465 RepID=A0A9Q9ANQ0_9PEZI|nr:putative transcription initiation factor TFIID component TAF4 [Septoria linicola]USW49750.1 Putative transcription initiation factor TFIID component TAF4 [Septoria linicola]